MTTKDGSGRFDFTDLSLPWKLLLTGFLVLLGAGYLAAATNARLAVGLTPASIAEHYGDKRVTTAERAAIESQGFVEEEFSLDELDEGGDHGGPHDSAHMDDMAATGDDTLPPQVLAQVSHVHWLGFSMLLLSIGSLTCLTRWSDGVKAVLVTVLFLSFLGDIAGVNLTRFVSDGFAWMTMVAGTLIGACLAVMSLRVLWELWGPRPARM